MESLVSNLLGWVSSFFGNLYADAPVIWGSKYPAFLGELLLLIIVIDLVIFGWRPLVKKFFPKSYGAVDYAFGQVTNLIWLCVLDAFMIYIGGALGEAWGRFLGISTMIWSTVGVVALLLLGKLAVKRHR